MKNTMKKGLAIFLIALMIFTSIPMAYASDIYESEENLVYSSDNAVGDTIVNAINDANQVVENDNGYGVFGLNLEGLTASVSFSAPDDSILIVAVYDETTNIMVTSGKAQVNSDLSNIEVTLAECTLPDYYIIKAFILNSDNTPVCTQYENREHTKVYEAFFEKNIFDFDEDKVINFDAGFESNFAVVSDDATVVTYSENENIVITDDYENGIFVFENATEAITSLTYGDILYYVYGEESDEYILTKVGSVETKNGITTITSADECEMGDLFSYIDVDTSKLETPQVFDFDAESGQINETKSYPLTSGAKEKEFKGSNYSLKLSAEGSITFHIKFHYDINLFTKDYYKFEYWVEVYANATADFNASGSFTKKCDIIETDIPIFYGIEVHVEVNLTIKASASINVVGNITFSMKNGASRETGGVQQKIEQKPTIELNIDIDGKYSISVIPELITGFRILKVFYVDLSVPVDFNTSGTLFIPTDSEEYRDHLCLACIAGNISATVSLQISVKFGLDRDKAESIISVTPVSKKFPLGEYYINLDNGIDFGWGKCPNITKKITVSVYDNSGNPVKDAVVSTTTGYCDADGDGVFKETSMNTDENGQAVFYFKKGNHEVVVKKDGIGTSGQKFEVLAIEKEINLVLFDAEYFNGHYYKVFDVSKTWIEAKTYCEDLGGHLVTITSQEEQTFIESIILIPSIFWIGASDRETEGVWKWITDEPFVYTNWGRNEPDNIDGADFGTIYTFKTAYNPNYSVDVGQWDDYPIYNHTQPYFICEWESIPENIQPMSYRMSPRGLSNEEISDAETTINGTTATRTDALIGAEYVVTVIKDEFAEDFLSNENLIYIDQKTADSSTISFDFVLPEGVTDYTVKIFGISHSHTAAEAVKENEVSATCTNGGSYDAVAYCSICGEEIRREKVNTEKLPHEYAINVTEPTCTEPGTKTYTCSCGDTYTETINSTGHDFDGTKCKNCDYDRSNDCSCNCHKSGISGFFWKIINFFNKIFKLKEFCSCGAKHW